MEFPHLALEVVKKLHYSEFHIHYIRAAVYFEGAPAYSKKHYLFFSIWLNFYSLSHKDDLK